MLSLSECRKHLPVEKFTDEEVEEIRTELYQIANILVARYLATKNKGEEK